MKLSINLNKKYIVDSFIQNWLKLAIERYIRKEIHLNKKSILNNYPNIKNIESNLILASKSLIVNHDYNNSGHILITIDPNKKSEENDAKLYDICALVNFGSLSSPACPIFTKTFDCFAKNFWTFYRCYEQGILLCP